MKFIVFIFLIILPIVNNAQRKHWTNDSKIEVKKDEATSYFTLSKTESKTFVLKRYYKSNDSIYEEINYLTKERLSRNGNYTLYFKNRKVAKQGQYSNNKKSGVWNYYFENGNHKESFTFLNGLKEGEYIDYKNNKIIAKYQYKNGTLKSLILLKDEQGNQIFKEDTSDIAVYTFVDQEAMFPGGQSQLELFVGENLNPPKAYLTTVHINYNIDSEGRITEVELNQLTQNNVKEVDVKEAFNVLAKMPRWEPAMKRGRVVKSKQLIKIDL